jgi:hypothetical protein
MKRTKFTATPTKCRDVQPGDAPGPPDDNEEVIYKITWDVVPFDPQADAAWGNSEQDEVDAQ